MSSQARTALAGLGLLAGLLASPDASVGDASGGPASMNAQQPNILLIVAEDLSARIGAFGDPVAHTPNLDRLAASGVRFPNVFTTAGVCAPSRAALITGMHQIAIAAIEINSQPVNLPQIAGTKQRVHTQGIPVTVQMLRYSLHIPFAVSSPYRPVKRLQRPHKTHVDPLSGTFSQPSSPVEVRKLLDGGQNSHRSSTGMSESKYSRTIPHCGSMK